MSKRVVISEGLQNSGGLVEDRDPQDTSLGQRLESKFQYLRKFLTIVTAVQAS